MEAGTNQAERRRWNDERWCAYWLKREPITAQVTPLLLEALAPRRGERILDVGSGGGGASLAAAMEVGEEGEVVGVDISVALCRLAAERAAFAGIGNVRFEVADAQTEPLGSALFDAAMSQFGVMFFDEPLSAFRNIHAHLRAGGRIAFACWQEIEANPWVPDEAIRPFLPPPSEPAAGKSPTGPFTLADPARTTTLLEQAGFADVGRIRHEREVEADSEAMVSERQLVFLGVPEHDLPAALAAARRYASRFAIGGGRSRFPIAFQLFVAAKPPSAPRVSRA